MRPVPASRAFLVSLARPARPPAEGPLSHEPYWGVAVGVPCLDTVHTVLARVPHNQPPSLPCLFLEPRTAHPGLEGSVRSSGPEDTGSLWPGFCC